MLLMTLKILYWALSMLTAGSIVLALSIWFNLLYGPDQGLGGVGSGIAVIILWILSLIIALINLYVGKKISSKENNRLYFDLYKWMIIFLAALPFLEKLVRISSPSFTN